MLNIDKLVVCYQKLEILKGISFNVPHGKVTVLIGSNGVGKSTALRAITGFANISSGKITLKGNDITNKPPYKIVDAGISFIDENVKIFPYLTVLDNLLIGAYKKQAWLNRHRSIERIFELFPRLKERLDQQAKTLSGGERKMLGIGRGLMSKPDLLILDEPSQGLAPIILMNMFNTIRNINQAGTTILLVEQNVYESLSIGNYGYVLENGSIFINGKCEDLLVNPTLKEAYLRI